MSSLHDKEITIFLTEIFRPTLEGFFEASAGQGLPLNDFGSEIAAFSNSYDRICKYFPHFPGILEPFKNAYGFLVFHSVATEH